MFGVEMFGFITYNLWRFTLYVFTWIFLDFFHVSSVPGLPTSELTWVSSPGLSSASGASGASGASASASASGASMAAGLRKRWFSARGGISLERTLPA